MVQQVEDSRGKKLQLCKRNNVFPYTKRSQKFMICKIMVYDIIELSFNQSTNEGLVQWQLGMNCIERQWIYSIMI